MTPRCQHDRDPDDRRDDENAHQITVASCGSRRLNRRGFRPTTPTCDCRANGMTSEQDRSPDRKSSVCPAVAQNPCRVQRARYRHTERLRGVVSGLLFRERICGARGFRSRHRCEVAHQTSRRGGSRLRDQQFRASRRFARRATRLLSQACVVRLRICRSPTSAQRPHLAVRSRHFLRAQDDPHPRNRPPRAEYHDDPRSRQTLG